MGDAGDYWRDVKAWESKEAYKWSKSTEGKAFAKKEKKFWTDFWNKVKENNFSTKSFDGNHHRISKGNWSFDFWSSTETVKTVEGKYESGWNCLNRQLDLLVTK